MNVLVTGGAGYIGSHTVRELLATGHRVTVLDDLSSGHRHAISSGASFVHGDLADVGALGEALAGVEAVVHFAGLLSVSGSVKDPAPYYATNVVKGLALLAAMKRRNIRQIIFSSTCAVYGAPVCLPMDEDHPQKPTSPYGSTKKAFERALFDFAQAGELRAVALRYFNAAGCHPDGSLGEDHDPEEHLIPLALDVALGRRPQLVVFGDDYETPDGTCIRDYIHVCDLARAHVLSLSALGSGKPFKAFNLGTGHGHSVREVIDSVVHVTGKPVQIQRGSRRPGDPPQLIAHPERARVELGFHPRYQEMDEIVETTFRWRRDHSGIV